MKNCVFLPGLLAFSFLFSAFAFAENCSNIQASFKTEHAFRGAYEKLRSLVLARNIDGLLKLTHESIRFSTNDGPPDISDPKEIREALRKILSPGVVTSVRAQKFEQLFCAYGHAGMGNGEIWFTASANGQPQLVELVSPFPDKFRVLSPALSKLRSIKAVDAKSTLRLVQAEDQILSDLEEALSQMKAQYRDPAEISRHLTTQKSPLLDYFASHPDNLACTYDEPGAVYHCHTTLKRLQPLRHEPQIEVVYAEKALAQGKMQYVAYQNSDQEFGDATAWSPAEFVAFHVSLCREFLPGSKGRAVVRKSLEDGVLTPSEKPSKKLETEIKNFRKKIATVKNTDCK